MTPLEICIPASGGIAMVAAINFAYGAYQRLGDIRAAEQFLDRWPYRPRRRGRDENISRIHGELFICVVAVAYAFFTFWLTGQLFD